MNTYAFFYLRAKYISPMTMFFASQYRWETDLEFVNNSIMIMNVPKMQLWEQKRSLDASSNKRHINVVAW